MGTKINGSSYFSRKSIDQALVTRYKRVVYLSGGF